MKTHKNILLAAIIAASAGAANAAVITDFSSFTQSPELLGGTKIGQNFATSTTVSPDTNTVTASWNGTATTGTAGQQVLLSDSFSLTTVGSRISVEFGSFAGTAVNDQAIGLSVASTEATTSRKNLINYYWRQAGDIDAITFDGSGLNSGFSNVAVTPNSLFIERTATGYFLGYTIGAVESEFATLTLGVGRVTANGSAVGLYSDMRNTNQVNVVNNFAHVIPEPSAALLGGLGLLALLRRRRN